MRERDESTLVAYVDGELDLETAREVEAMLERDAESREFVAALRECSASVRVAYNDALYEEVPARLVSILERARTEGQAAPVSPGRHHSGWRVALAASLAALAVGFGGGFISGDWRAHRGVELATQLRAQDREVFERTLNRTLENEISGTAVSWRNPETGTSGLITPVRTYKDASGRYCREYRKAVEARGELEETYVLACRTGEGTWKTEAIIFKNAT